MEKNINATGIIATSNDNKTDFQYQRALIENARGSYISKECFIEIINNLVFDKIKSADIYFITGYKYIPENKEKDRKEYVDTYGYDVHIS